MNETKLNDRQQLIIHQLMVKPCSRSEIEQSLRKKYPLSKVTLLRDLNYLISQKWVEQLGKGRAIKYQINDAYRILIPINPDYYFSETTNVRNFVKDTFDVSVFDKLKLIYTDDELRLINGKLKRLSNQKRELDPSIFQKELERITIEFAWKSSRIEGNTYTLLETEQLILRKEEAKGHTKEEAMMILNHKDALEYILCYSSKFVMLSLEKILELHSLIVKGLGVSAGIRAQQVGIAGTNYLPVKDKNLLEKYLERIAEVINREKIPLVKALIAVCLISYLQPFTDGNKRTGRMIANALLIANDIIPLSYRNVDELAYKKALIIFYEQNIISGFKKIFTDQLIYSNTHYFQI